MRMKVKGRKGFTVRNVLPPKKSLLPIVFIGDAESNNISQKIFQQTDATRDISNMH